jgi:hypothetical protein
MAAPYNTVMDCLNVAIVRANDAMKQAGGAPVNQIGGEVIGAQQVFTRTAVNAGWQRMQDFLVSQNYSRLINTVNLNSISPVAVTDPGIFCFIDWDGYFDGVTLQPLPVLPQDLTTPLRLKERVHGQAGINAEFTPMEYFTNGLTGGIKQARNMDWAWDDDNIIFPGSTSIMDFELRYASFLPDFADDGTTAWYNQPVPIMRAQDALAWYILSEFANGRGDMDGAAIDAKAEAAALKLVQREQQNDSLRSEWVIPAIPASTGATHYDIVNTVINAVKTRLNSQTSNPTKDIVVTNQAYMQQCLNNAWRKMQTRLWNMGYIRFTDETTLTNLGPKIDQDPSIQPFLDWTGYNNGTTLDTAIVLPENLIQPLRLWQRVTGQNAEFSPICLWMDGMPSIPATPYTQTAEWRGDAIYFTGFNQPIDLRLRFDMYLPDFVSTNALPWYMQEIKIVRCSEALSLYICAEIAMSRPDLELDAMAFTQGAEAAADLIKNRDVRQRLRTNVRRLSRSGRLEGAQGGGGQNYGSWN